MSALQEHLEHLRWRVLQDAMAEATSKYWLRRAEAFDAAKHRPGIDWPGNATVEELRARWRRLDEIARACRNRAESARMYTDDADVDVDALLDDLERERGEAA